MKTKPNNLIIGVFLLCVLCLFSGCKKKTTEPDPVVKDPPSFTMEAYTFNLGGTYYVRFIFDNRTEAVKLSTLTVTSPSSLKYEYTGDGSILSQYVKTELPDNFPATIGFWSFKFTGTRASDNSYFTTTSKIQVTG